MRAVLGVHRLQIVVAHLFVSLDAIDRNACDDFAASSRASRSTSSTCSIVRSPTFEPFLRDRPDDRYLRALVVLLRGRLEAVANDLRW